MGPLAATMLATAVLVGLIYVGGRLLYRTVAPNYDSLVRSSFLRHFLRWTNGGSPLSLGLAERPPSPRRRDGACRAAR